MYFFLIIYTRTPPVRITNGITNYTVDINNKYIYKYRYTHWYAMLYKTRNNLMEIRIIFRRYHTQLSFFFVPRYAVQNADTHATHVYGDDNNVNSMIHKRIA